MNELFQIWRILKEKSSSAQQTMPSIDTLLFIPFKQFTHASNRFYWLYFIPFIIIVACLFLLRNRKNYSLASLQSMLFNRPLNKQSMWLDIRFFAINSLIYYLLMRSVVQISYLLATNLMDHGILKLFTEYQGFFSGTSSNKILATIVIFLCMDFGIFIAHYAFHHVPTLWLFHRVHHSAKTLTPFTMFRFHPLDDGLTALTAGFLSFIAIRLATFFISDFQAYSFEGVNIFLLIFYLTGFQLRHTHLWLVWPKPFSYFCISPAEHQIHHSSLAPHINKNFGFVLSIWDKLFKTHYPVSKTPEAYKIGIDEPSERIRTLRDCYLEPLERVAKHSVLLCAVLTFTISIVILRGLLL